MTNFSSPPRPNQDHTEFISSVELDLGSVEVEEIEIGNQNIEVLVIEGADKTHKIPLRDAEVGAMFRKSALNNE